MACCLGGSPGHLAWIILAIGIVIAYWTALFRVPQQETVSQVQINLAAFNTSVEECDPNGSERNPAVCLWDSVGSILCGTSEPTSAAGVLETIALTTSPGGTLYLQLKFEMARNFSTTLMTLRNTLRYNLCDHGDCDEHLIISQLQFFEQQEHLQQGGWQKKFDIPSSIIVEFPVANHTAPPHDALSAGGDEWTLDSSIFNYIRQDLANVGVRVAVGAATQPLDQLNSPGAIAFHEGVAYIVDSGNNRVLRKTPDGDPEIFMGGKGPGTRLDQLNGPSAISFDHNATYVVERGNDRVLIFSDPFFDRSSTFSLPAALSACSSMQWHPDHGRFVADECPLRVASASLGAWTQDLPRSQPRPRSGRAMHFKWFKPHATDPWRKAKYISIMTSLLALALFTHANGGQGSHLGLAVAAVALVPAGAVAGIVQIPWASDSSSTLGSIVVGTAVIACGLLMPWAVVPLYLFLQDPVETVGVACESAVDWELHMFTLLCAIASISLWHLLPQLEQSEVGHEDTLPKASQDILDAAEASHGTSIGLKAKAYRALLLVFWLQSGINDTYSDGNFISISRLCGYGRWFTSLACLGVAIAVQNVLAAALVLKRGEPGHCLLALLCLLSTPPLKMLGYGPEVLILTVVRFAIEDIPQLLLQADFTREVKRDVYVIVNMLVTLAMLVHEMYGTLKSSIQQSQPAHDPIPQKPREEESSSLASTSSDSSTEGS